jgi:hypothetical protein
MRIVVKGDHPILKRPDKIFTDPALATEYFNELFEAGYENLEMTPYLTDNESEELVHKIMGDVLLADDFMFCPECKKVCPVYTDWSQGAILKCENCEMVLEV